MTRLVALVLAVFATATGAGCSSQQDVPAKEAAVRDGIHAIQVAVFLASGGFDRTRADTFPDPGLVSPSGLKRYLDFWPKNPYTGRPMTQGTGAGDFRYALGPGGTSCRLVGFGANGKILITVAGP